MIRAFYNKILLIIDFLQFGVTAHTIDDLDSPFFYDFHKSVVNSLRPIQYDDINAYIKTIKHNTRVVSVNSVGAESKFNKSNKLEIKQIAKSAVSDKYKCSLLLKIVQFFQSNNVLELGTSLGVSALYLSKIDRVKTIDTIEGQSEICDYAKKHINSTKIKFTNALFTEAFDRLDKRQFDCIIIDGDHTEEATLSNFKRATELLAPNGIIVLDDIYWSTGMKQAWKEAKSMNKEFHSINLFFYGILFKSHALKELSHINIFPYPLRWRLGLKR